MEATLHKFEKIVPQLDELFLKNIHFGLLEWDTLKGLLLGVYQNLSVIGKLSVLDGGLLLDMNEDVFHRDKDMIEAWHEICVNHVQEDSNEEVFVKYLVEAIENFCNAFEIARHKGYNLAILCAKNHIYLWNSEVRELGGKNFEECFYDVRTSDDAYCYSARFSHVHKQAWIEGFYNGFILGCKGINHESIIKLASAGHKDKIKRLQDLLDILPKCN